MSATATIAPAEIARPTRSSAVRAMDESEIRAFLSGGEWGVLATRGGEGVYAVPVSYGYDASGLYVASGPGRKLSNLLEDPALCLTVVEVENPACWRSVVVTGRAVPLTGIRERATAMAALGAQRSAGHRPSLRDLERIARGRLFRVEVNETTGRQCGWG
jgi:nitroimidazol reductase NimA-like FMN-containing flavoprotein (pyridoxamine 5'-phosphate oxidase superfamily)